MKDHEVDLQIACDVALPVPETTLITWAKTALHDCKESTELTLRVVNAQEIQDLNNTYRKINKTTNVLAFPSNIPDVIKLDFPFIGDVIICPDVLEKESIEQGKNLKAHWAHIIIHGVLHLLGYDHIDEKDATLMQQKEVILLESLGFTNPYSHEDKYFDE